MDPRLEQLLRRGSVSTREVAAALGVSRQAAHRRLAGLVEKEALKRTGSGRATRYEPIGVGFEHSYPLRGLGEDAVWSDLQRQVSDIRDLPGPAIHLYNYALTEIVNNAIDHSGGAAVVVRVDSEAGVVAMEVEDDGVGLFAHVCSELGLGSELEALQELSKGKVTTAPDAHSGEGLFFVSKAADRFTVESGELRWIVDNNALDVAVGELETPRVGTWVRFEARPDAPRDLSAIFAEYTRNFEFSRTRTVVSLFEIGVTFVSRSEAKRLLRGLEKFREVVFDFAGVQTIGQGFADEVFRVWANAHPDVALEPVNMNGPIQMFVGRAQRAREAKAG